jgi:glucose/arabinose dehydrogenase
MNRRQFLVTAGLAAGLAGCGNAPSETDPEPTPTGEGSGSTPNGADSGFPDAIALDPVAGGMQAPLDVAFAPEMTYVAEQQGQIRIIDDDLRKEPLLDLRGEIEVGGEKGLLGIALHPDFATNRRLFVRYSAPRRSGTPSNYSHTFVLSEFRVTEDGRSVRSNSERTVLEIPEPQGNHNAGAIVFGPEGYLFVAVGDGGAGGDQGGGHVDDWYDRVDGGNGQDVTANLLGSILRIDVNGGSAERGDYAIPDDNPLVGREGLDEHYAWGFRNPWRLAVDGETLYAGDVGQNRYEEIDRVVAGGNYGWNVTEGTHCYDADTCPDSTPKSVRGGERLRDPVVEYPHGDDPVSGISVITGNVYRGTAMPGLEGQFVFGDYRPGGDLFVATPREEGLWPTAAVPIADDDAGRLQQILSIDRNDGELYVLGIGEGGGGVYRLALPD